ncbi:MAG: ATP-binding cassette domain-containing protein, partial [Woeseiaceae bacterium]
DWLRAYPGTLLLISHDRDFLDSVAGHIVHLENRRAILYAGNYSAFERIRAERLANQQAQYRKQQREIEHIRSFVDRFRAKASKARQAQSRIKALQRMELIAPAHVDSPFHFALRSPAKNPNPLLRIDGASVGYGSTTVLSGVRLSLTPGDRIGLLGANGAGKSTLIKLVAGILEPASGERVPANDLAIGYFAQHQVDQLDPLRSPLEHFFEIEPEAREADLRKYLGGFGFSNDTVFMPTAPFSGGEKSRLALALLVYRRPNLLLLDEPTNHLDLEMRQALSLALQEFAGAMLLVSHDRHLLRVTSDRLFLVHGGSVVEFDGSLDDYPAWLAARNRSEAKSGGNGGEEKTGAAQTLAARKDRKRREAAERQSLKPAYRRLEKAEAALE